MNPIVILLGILIVIVLYVLYSYLYPSNIVIANSASLSQANPPITNFKNPSSQRYALGIWVYINSFNSTAPQIIYSRTDNNQAISLSVDPTTGPTLKFGINTVNSSPPTQFITITDNFPIQKWVCVIISADNQFIDAYLDGKLVVSTKLPNPVSQYSSDPNTFPIMLGNSVDGMISRFTQWSQPINPQQAYDFYNVGNGSSVIYSKYGANLNIIKDNIISSQIKLF